MSIQIEYLQDGYGIEFFGTGIVTGEEIYDANNIIYSGESLARQKYQILNLSDANRVRVSQDEAVKLANQDIEASRTNPDIVIAIVATLDHAFGLGRMWEAHVNKSSFETMVFRKREEALAWIDKRLGIIPSATRATPDES